MTVAMICGMLWGGMSAEAALLHVRWHAETPLGAKKLIENAKQLRAQTGSTYFIQQSVSRSLAYEVNVVFEGDYEAFTRIPESQRGNSEILDDRQGDTYSIRITLTGVRNKLFDLGDIYPDTFEQKFSSLEDLRRFLERWKVYPVDDGTRFPLAAWIESRNLPNDVRKKLVSHYLVGIYAHSRGKTISLVSHRDLMEEFYRDPENMWRVIMPKTALTNHHQD